jgi:hypothetical protein
MRIHNKHNYLLRTSISFFQVIREHTMNKFSSLILTIIASMSVYAQKIEAVYLNPKDSASNMYLIVYPPKLFFKSFMLLIPSLGEKPSQVLAQTKLPEYAASKGILTIIPTFKTGINSFGIDSATQQSLLEIIEHVSNTNNLSAKKFFIGGFSIGGSCAVKYAELANLRDYKYKPNAVFGIDPPLDFERIFNSCNRTIRLLSNKHQSPVSRNALLEAYYLINRITSLMGGTPFQVLSHYYNISPYSFSDTVQNAVKSLVSQPIMLFTEPDIKWNLDSMNKDYSSMNAFDCAAMINELKLLGNLNAFLVATTEKGYRQPGNIRTPHSWSISKPEDLVNWLIIQK